MHDPPEVEGFDPELAEEDSSSKRLNLSTVQVGASAGAAVTSALAASFFGVAGTLIGAAVGSIISTVAGAIYAESMRRAAERVRTTQAIVVSKVAPTVVHPAVTVPTATGPARTSWWRRRPVAMAAMMLAGFVIALGVITVAEDFLGGTVSGEKGTSSVGRVFGQTGTSSDSTPTQTPSSTPAQSATPTATTSAPASHAPVATSPGASESTSPTQEPTPSTLATAAPSVAPSATASAGTGQLDGTAATTPTP